VAKRVTMVAAILDGACTGCDKCVLVCPTLAITMRPRTSAEPGPGRNIAVVNDGDCYNAQNCLEMCPDNAIEMRRLREPFEVGGDQVPADPDAVAALCLQAGVLPDMLICVCTNTVAGELATAILNGAESPDQVALATGARTGCTEICIFPIMRLLEAAGHGDKAPALSAGYQWYGRPGQLMQQVGADGRVDPDLVATYPHLRLQQDVAALTFNFDEA
jgi:NAD-dependent dihydropyrimidine dehydrogenase PreA subunit